MNNLEPGVAFGASKAGMGFNVIKYITTPQTILQCLSLMFNLIIYFCINGKGYNREGICLFNNNASVCKMGTMISGLAVVASIIYLGSEYLFQTTSSVKMRRYSIRTSLGIGFSFAVLYFLLFAYLSISWSKAEYPPFGFGLNSCRTAIAFSFFAILSFASSIYFTYKYIIPGVDTSTFTCEYYDNAFGVRCLRKAPDGTEYTGYATGNANEPQYADQFNQNMQEVQFNNQPNYQQYSY